jgi:Zn-dependent protease
MINKKEIFLSLSVILLISFTINLLNDWNEFLVILSSVAIVFGANIFTKKILAYYLDSEIEIKLWQITRIGVRSGQHFKRPFPAGAFFPIISKIFLFPFKSFIWMASLVFDIKPKVYRPAKRHGLYSFSEVTESQMGIIAAAGIVINLALALIGYFAGFTLFAQLNIYYAFFNMLPISDLDGNKIFFGNLVLWSFLASLTLAGLLLSILII